MCLVYDRKLSQKEFGRDTSFRTSASFDVMMSKFYARYVPPTSANTEVVNRTTAAGNGGDAIQTAKTASAKRQATVRLNTPAKKRKLNDETNREDTNASAVPGTLTAESRPEESGIKKPPRKEKKKKKSREDEKHASGVPTEAVLEADGHDESSKHTRVLSRFEKARHKSESHPAAPKSEVVADTAVPAVHPDRAAIVNNLEPIPQPRINPPPQERPTYSAEPEWLRKPVRVGQEVQCKFEELSLQKTLVQNLKVQKKEHALPVQAAVLPLLLDKGLRYRNDLCVAAATGSGKTLSYVLPILNEIRNRRIVRLRAVIVVPTRALVKQVQHTIESCASGIDIRIGTAEGSRTLTEEQALLVEEVSVYNPEEYKRQQEAPIDWDTFSLENTIDQALQEDSLADYGRIKEYNSKIDILICTPGRLIEHLQHTKGFTLDDVHWFIVDEADRLLDESYHEWLDVVLPALKSTKATEPRDLLLKHMHMDVPQRAVTKILLSATMTHDISQLLSLDLRNPKLVVVESEDIQEDTPSRDEAAEYQLPPRLSEHAVALKDSENKPLYLLELLNKHVFKRMSEIELRDGLKEDAKALLGAGSLETSALTEDSDSGSDSSDRSGDGDTRSDSSSMTDGTVSSKASKGSNRVKRKFLAELLQKHQSKLADQRVLIFTKSTESAHRLSRLLSILSPMLAPIIATFTKSTSSSKVDQKSSKALNRSRAQILESFTSGKTRILVSTDLAARGLDIPQLEHVINYDVPTSALTYVHRVGRTARAGLAGKAWTLVEHRQGKWFWETIGGKSSNDDEKKAIGRADRTIQKVNVTIDKEQWAKKYEEALTQLGEDVKSHA